MYGLIESMSCCDACKHGKTCSGKRRRRRPLQSYKIRTGLGLDENKSVEDRVSVQFEVWGSEDSKCPKWRVPLFTEDINF